jgi:hypothetical protein
MRVLLPLATFLALLTTSVAQPGAKVTREKIIEQNEKRKGQLNLMLFETRGKIADHNTGRSVLDEEEKSKLEKRAEMIQRKLDKLMEVDEEEIQRQIRREQLRLERRGRLDAEL